MQRGACLKPYWALDNIPVNVIVILGKFAGNISHSVSSHGQSGSAGQGRRVTADNYIIIISDYRRYIGHGRENALYAKHGKTGLSCLKQWVRNYVIQDSFVRYRETSHCQVRLARLFWGQQSHNCHLIANFSPNSDLLGHFFPLFWSCPAAPRYPYSVSLYAICTATSTSALGLIVRSLVLCWFWPFVPVFSHLAWFLFLFIIQCLQCLVTNIYSTPCLQYLLCNEWVLFCTRWPEAVPQKGASIFLKFGILKKSRV